MTRCSLDAREVVVEHFRCALGREDPLSLTSALLDDLGVDSIVLVTILMDLMDELSLDLASAPVKLKHIRTLEDVVRLVESLWSSRVGR